MNAVKCNLTELTTKSACAPLVVCGVDTYAHVSEFHGLVDRSVAYVQEAFPGVFCSVAAHCPGSSPPTPFPHSFHCFNSVTGACSSYRVGAHGSVTRICQPWEQSSSRSWLPIVEAPGCLRHSTFIFATQLLMQYSEAKPLICLSESTGIVFENCFPTSPQFTTF